VINKEVSIQRFFKLKTLIILAGLLIGVLATFLGGCPLRQLVLSGEGDTDAAVTVLGLFAGAAFAHNFGLTSTAGGPSEFGPLAVILGLVITICLGLLMRGRLT